MDHTTQLVVGALAGFALGILVALLNGRISRRAVEKGTSGALTVMVVCRMFLDLVVLLGLYLLRSVIPLPFTAILIGAATGLVLGGVVSAAMLDRQIKERSGAKKKQ